MKMIDGQIHIWLPNAPDRPWPRTPVNLHGEPYSAEQAIAQMDAAGVHGAVLIPPSWYGGDNSYALEAAAAHPGRFAVVGRYDHESPDARETLERWRDAPGMVGLRVSLHEEGMRPLFVDPTYDWFWARCEQLDLPVNVYLPDKLKLLEPIVERHSGLRLIVDHAGRAARGPKDGEAWQDIGKLLALARHPNVAVKVTSLPCFSTEPYPFPGLHAPIRAIYDGFGAQRMIWGSDVTRLSCSYEENVRLFSDALPFLSEGDKQWIFARSVARWCDVAL